MPKKKVKDTDSDVSDFGVDTAKGGVIFTAASIIRAIGTLLLLIVLARLLNPADYGLYTIAIAVVTIVGLNTDFGIGVALRKKLPEAKTNERVLNIINNSYYGAAFAALLIAIPGLVFSNYIAVNIYHNAVLIEPIMIAFISIIFSTLFSLNIDTLLGLRKDKEAGIGYILYSLTQLILSTVLVILGYGVLGALIGMLISFIITFLVTFAFVVKYVNYKLIKPSKKTLKELFQFGIPVFISSNISSNSIYNLGIILLGIFASPIIVGNYGAAFKLGSFSYVIILAGMQMLVPVYSHMISDKNLSTKTESLFNNSVYYSLLFLLPILAYLTSVSKSFIYIFLGSNYTLAPIYFPIIAGGIIAGILYSYGGQIVVGHGKIKAYTLYILSISFVVVILLIILTPLFKVYGVLISLFVIAPILLDLAFLRFMVKELHIRFYWFKPLKIILATVILWLILAYVSTLILQGRYLIFANGILALALYLPILALFRGIDKEDIEFISRVSENLHINFIMKYILQYTELFIRKVNH